MGGIKPSQIWFLGRRVAADIVRRWRGETAKLVDLSGLRVIAHGPEAINSPEPDPAFMIDLRAAVTWCRWSFHPASGINHYREAAHYILAGQVERARKALATHFARFQPRTLEEAVFEDPRGRDPWATLSPYTLMLPWFVKPAVQRGQDGSGNQNFGPMPPRMLEKELQRTVALVRSIRRHGYAPGLHRQGFIRGYFLVGPAGPRFHILGGFHRASVLAALGVTHVPASFHPATTRGVPRAVLRDHHGRWPHVVNGSVSPQAALEMFDTLCTPRATLPAQTGSERVIAPAMSG